MYQKKSKKMSTRLLLFILPVVIAGLGILAGISIISSKQTISEQIQSQMDLQLEGQKESIENGLDSVSALAGHIAAVVGSTYKSVSLAEYEAMLSELIFTNDMVMGSGIWFEPYVYDAEEKYIGPYIYKDGEAAAVTYDYSNAEYDYFAYEFYTNVSNGVTEAVFTEPYYDETSGAVMSSCSAPIYDENGKFLGAVTADINLETIQKLVTGIQVGKTGRAFLLNASGQYLAQEDSSKIMNEKITEAANSSLAEAGTVILKEEAGYTTYTDETGLIDAYYTTVGPLKWTLVLNLSNEEQTEPIVSLGKKMMAVAVVVLLVVVLTILGQISGISRQLKGVRDFAGRLSEGDFTIEQLKIKQNDEVGAMGASLNEMYQNNKEIITKISNYSQILQRASLNLEKDGRELSEQFGAIEGLMRNVNDDMSSVGAATEELSASTEEVNSSVSVLVAETVKSTKLANEIKERAGEVEKNSQRSYEQARQLSNTHEENLNISIENADVVKNIGAMAEVIAEIADQINLLSLNASIEAARAGEMGKGFAVVAGEIGKLAGETSQAVSQIKATIFKVQSAFDELVKNSASMLSFVKDTVTPDYDVFVGVAKQYGEDAVTIEEFSNNIAEMTDGIERIISEVAEAIQNIAEASQNTVENGNNIMHSIEVVSEVVGEVAKMSEEQQGISTELTGVVDNFTLK